MKRLISIFMLLSFFTPIMAEACCAGPGVHIMPYDSRIPQNPVFIMSFSESHFKLKDKIGRFRFYAVINNQKKVKLKVSDIWYSGLNCQLILTSSKTFRIGDSVSLSIITTHDYDSTLKTTFMDDVAYKKWAVTAETDRVAPRWATDSVTSVFLDSRNSSASYLGFEFHCPVQDEAIPRFAYERYGSQYYPILYEITFNGEKAIVTGLGFSPRIFWGMCGSDFSSAKTKQNVAIIRPLDLSGNFGESKTVSFVFPDK